MTAKTVLLYVQVVFLILVAGFVLEALTYSGVIFRYFGLDILLVSGAFLLLLIVWRLAYHPVIQKFSPLNKYIFFGAITAQIIGALSTIADKNHYINFVLSKYHFHYEPVFLLGIIAFSYGIAILPNYLLIKYGKLILLIAPVVSLYIVAVFNVWPFNFLIELTKEDHLIENSQFIVLCVAALYIGIKAYTNRGFHRWLFIAVCVILVFIAGEEVSWGQRTLNIRPAQYFMRQNIQQETNVHNLVIIGYRPIVFAYLLTGFFCGLVPLLIRLVPHKHMPPIIQKYMPRWYLIFYFLPVALYNVVTMIFIGHTIGNFAEPVELLLNFGFLFYLIAINSDKNGLYQKKHP